jgi:hypothetical protein
MTTVTVTPSPPVQPTDAFPELPPRDDMLNVIYLHEPGHVPALRRHFGNLDTTIVASEIPIGWNTSQREGLQQPDLFIAFSVDRAVIIARKGYDISAWGKAPDFVLEIASENTAQNDEGSKRAGYADFRVTEYWRFDHTGGTLYAAALAGDRLVNDVYRPIAIHKLDDARYWGHSEVLNLDVCWEYGRLRFYDPVAERYLPTYDDEADGRIAAESQRDTERYLPTYDDEADGRIAAESQRDTERDARLAVESERDEERRARLATEARNRQLEEEIRRLQNP